MRENLINLICMDRVIINGKMIESTQDSTKIMLWKDMVSSLGLMDVCTKVSILTTKSMELESSLGPTAENTKEIGLMVSNMGRASMLTNQETKDKEFGKMGRKLGG
jgi:hypothetical protein